MAALTFLHTAQVNADTFDALMKEIAPNIEIRHEVHPGLLVMAMAGQNVTLELSRAIATMPGDLVVCTCSTLGDAAERIGLAQGRAVLRIDRPMAEAAVTLGRRLLVVCAVASTVEPTLALLRDVAAPQRLDLRPLLVAEAWNRMQAGDQPGYWRLIADAVRRALGDADAVVLAQGSMAGASALLTDLPVAVLSSPRLGIEAALSQLVGE